MIMTIIIGITVITASSAPSVIVPVTVIRPGIRPDVDRRIIPGRRIIIPGRDIISGVTVREGDGKISVAPAVVITSAAVPGIIGIPGIHIDRIIDICYGRVGKHPDTRAVGDHRHVIGSSRMERGMEITVSCRRSCCNRD
jgi:hypothetical protein